MGRQKKGQDTWKRLRDWHDGQTSSARLASRLLLLLGYTSIDPSHPMGGPDGKKDIVCKKDGKKWIVGVYFPNGQKDFKEIEKKFEQDLEGIDKNEGDGFIFISNQELKLSEKDLLKNKQDFDIELFHLETLASVMDTPIGFALRMEFLDIEMNKEEQLSYMVEIHEKLDEKIEKISSLEAENLQLKNIIDQSDTNSTKYKPADPHYATPKEMNAPYDYLNISKRS